MSPTTDDLRRVLEERAAARVDDVLALADPAHAAAGPRLAAVHAKTRRTRRLRAAGAAAAVAAVVAGALAVPGLLTPDRVERPELPASRSAPAPFDEDGLPPLGDAWGRPLTAAASLTNTGPRYEDLTVALGSGGPDAGFSYTVRCVGDPTATVRVTVGGRHLATAPCGASPAAVFTDLSLAAWARVGLQPGSPAQLRLEFAGEEPPAAASAVLAVYGGDVAELPRLGASPLPADVGFVPLLSSVEFGLRSGLSVRAVRIRPASLDSFFVATVCTISGDDVPAVRVRVGDAEGRLTCDEEDQGETIAWPIPDTGDLATFWSERGLVAGSPVTVLLAVDAPLTQGAALGRLDVGVYGQVDGVRPVYAATGPSESPVYGDRAAALYEQLTTGSPRSESFDGPMSARRVATWIWCGGQETDLQRLAVRIRFNKDRQLVVPCTNSADDPVAVEGEFDPSRVSGSVVTELVTRDGDRWVPATGLDGRTVARVALYVLST